MGGGKFIDPTWRKFSIGPWIRRERDKRFYNKLFGHAGIHGIHKLLLLLGQKMGVVKMEDFCCLDPYFVDLNSDFPIVREYFDQIILNETIDRVDTSILVNAIAVHIRLGDYSESMRIPLEWYKGLSWLEKHICIIPMFPRRPGCSVVENKDITPIKVKALTSAADKCWAAIMNKDLNSFAQAFMDSFNAQIAMFPAMMQPGVKEYIDKWRHKALAWKMVGAGGGGYLALVVDKIPEDAIRIRIRRKDVM